MSYLLLSLLNCVKMLDVFIRFRVLLGVLTVSLAGLLCLSWDPFLVRERSLDNLFLFRNWLFAKRQLPTQQPIIIFMKDKDPGDWGPYIELLTRMADYKVKVAVFDFVFKDNRWSR